MFEDTRTLDYTVPTRGVCSFCKQPVDVDPGGFAAGHDRYSHTMGVRTTCWGTQEPVTELVPANAELHPDFDACYGDSTPLDMLSSRPAVGILDIDAALDTLDCNRSVDNRGVWSVYASDGTESFTGPEHGILPWLHSNTWPRSGEITI